MNSLDITLLCVLLVSCAVGLRSGVIRQVFSLVSIAGAVLLGVFLHEPAGALLLENGIVADRRMADILGFVAAAGLGMLALNFLARGLARFIEDIHLGWLDRLLGGGVGLVTGLLLACLVVSAASYIAGEDSPLVKNSVLAPRVVQGYGLVKDKAPGNIEKAIDKAGEIRERHKKQDSSRPGSPLN